MADVATNGVQDQEQELTMEDPLEDVQSITTLQESTKNALNSSNIIHELNGFENTVNGGNYSNDLLSLSSQPREPEVFSPEQPDPYPDQIITNDLDPLRSDGEVKDSGEGMLIDFDAGAGGRPLETADVSSNPFLGETGQGAELSGNVADDELEEIQPSQYSGDIMQTSFFGDASELASLNPFDSRNNQADIETSPVVDTNPFMTDAVMEPEPPANSEQQSGEPEQVHVASDAEQDIPESGHEISEPDLPVYEQDISRLEQQIPVVESGHDISEPEQQIPQSEQQIEEPQLGHLPETEYLENSHFQPSATEDSQNETSEEKLENEYSNGDSVVEVGSSVDLPIVDNVPIDSIHTTPEEVREPDALYTANTAASELPAPVDSTVATEVISKAQEVEKVEAKKAASPTQKTAGKDTKTKSAPAAAKTTRKTPSLQKSSSVPVRTSAPQRPPLTRASQSTAQPSPRKTEARQTQSARKATSELRRSASSAATPSSRVRSSPATRTAETPSPGATPRKAGDIKKRGSTGSAETPSPRPGGKGPIKSRVGSLDNANHSPAGGNVKIFNQKAEVKASSKIGSKDNAAHKPGGGNVKIENKRQSYDGTKSRIGSMDNAKHVAGGGERKIQSTKLEWKAQSRIGSLDNATHKPGGGEKKIESKKLDFKDKAQSKVGSKDYLSHKPGGGDKKIYDEKVKWKAESKCGSMDNAQHKAGGGERKIDSQKLNFKSKAQSKVGSTENASHKPGGGDKKIQTEKVNWKAESKVGSLDNANHTPGGGDKKIESEKMTFRETAEAKTDSGVETTEGN